MWDAGGFGVIFGLAIWWYLIHPKWIIPSLIFYTLLTYGDDDDEWALNGKPVDRGTYKFAMALATILGTIGIWGIWAIATGQL